MSHPTNTTTSILLITDNPHLCQPLVQFLTGHGIDVKLADSGQITAEAQVADNDIAVIDCDSLPNNGISLCIKLHCVIPVIMIEGRSDEYSTTAALNSGADDYMPKPVRYWELLARIRNILRRRKPVETLQYRNLSVDTVKGVVYKDGQEIFLSALEYRILLIFLANKDKVLSRQQLLDEIWNIGGDYVNDNTLTVYIKRIREKIEENPALPQTIKTVRGKGYKIGD